MIENCVNGLFFHKSKTDHLTKQDVCNVLPAAAKESFFYF